MGEIVIERDFDTSYARPRELNGPLHVLGADNSSRLAARRAAMTALALAFYVVLLLRPNWLPQGKSGERRPPSTRTG